MLIIGVRALTYSANEASDDDEQLSNGELTLTFVIAAAFAIGLFVALPELSLLHLPAAFLFSFPPER